MTIAPIRLNIRTTHGLSRKRSRKAEEKIRAMPSGKTRLVRAILLNNSFIGTSKIGNRRQNDSFDSGPTIVRFLRRYFSRP
jgi:hypothetical protein